MTVFNGCRLLLFIRKDRILQVLQNAVQTAPIGPSFLGPPTEDPGHPTKSGNLSSAFRLVSISILV